MPGSKLSLQISEISALARRDSGQRGFAALAGEGDLKRSAEELLHGERILIVTGFCIRAAKIGENDGLSGALSVADALRQLGKDVVLVTDRYSAGLLVAAGAAFNHPFRIVLIGQEQSRADEEINRLLREYQPTHVIAIERPGNAIDGHRYSMRGEMLDDLVPSVDLLLAPHFLRDYVTIAIGDGGNELGLGSLRERLKNHIAYGELIFSTTAADLVIPAGTSNWGAHALVAVLSLLSGRQFSEQPAKEREVLEALLAAGAVDGCTRRQELSVDGIGWGEYADAITAIYEPAYLTSARQTASSAVPADVVQNISSTEGA